MREEIHALYSYSEGGITYGDVINEMNYEDRQWNLNRIYKQLKDQEKSLSESRKETRTPSLGGRLKRRKR